MALLFNLHFLRRNKDGARRKKLLSIIKKQIHPQNRINQVGGNGEVIFIYE